MANAVVPSKANEVLPLDQVPSYLKGNEGNQGMEALGAKDFKIPRVTLLQALSPECRAFPGVAIPGHFWHTGANISLGPKFKMVCGIVSKKAILFKPRHMGGGILAFSSDCQTWDTGANRQFPIKVSKDSDKIVTWSTGKNVPSSGLLDWGSSDPDVENSQPAATMIYEYLVHLHDYPQHSPALFSMSKTALNSARAINTAMMMAKGPIASLIVEISSKEVTENSNTWCIPTGVLAGRAKEDVYNMVKAMGQAYSSYKVEYTQDDIDATPPSNNAPSSQKDEIPF